MDAPIRVAVGVTDYLVREGIVRALDASRRTKVVSMCSSLGALRESAEDDAPDVVLTTLQLAPSYTDEGLRLAAELRRSHREVGVVLLGDSTDSPLALALFQDEAPRAYLLTRQIRNSRQLMRAIDEVAAGRSLLDTAAVNSLRDAQSVTLGLNSGKLTAREREILSLVAEAESNRAIAHSLGITTRAVERHINSIFRKLEIEETQDVNRRVKAALVFTSMVAGSRT